MGQGSILSKWRMILGIVAIFIFTAINASAANVYGVTTANQLVSFDTATPGTVTTIGTISGLQSGENILGIDFRPANGQLYALGSTSRVYTVSLTTGVATAVGAPFTPALSGTNFAFDFNPVPDRIRVVSNTGQNLRLNPNDGSVAGVDGNINGGAANTTITAAGYTNNFKGTTSTVLYVIDSTTNTLYTQNPPNAGTLVPVGSLGATTLNTSGVNGFDIDFGTNTAYAALTVGTSQFYTINLTTGAATLVGAIGGGLNLVGMAVEVGSLPSTTVFGVTTTNQLVSFNSSSSNTIRTTNAITGLQAGENIVGITFRPITGVLYGVGSASRLYTINTRTGAATFVAALSVPLSATGVNFGVAFNPTVDRIRIVSDSDQNLRVNPVDGVTIADTPVAYAAGDPNAGANPNITSVAYTNAFPGATTTALRDVDSNLDNIVLQNNPNDGILTTGGSLRVNTTANVGYAFAVNNAPFLALQVGTDATSKLYRVNARNVNGVTTISSSFVSPIGASAPLRGIAISAGATAANVTNQLDFDGDRRADYSVFRDMGSNWFIFRSSNNSFTSTSFGTLATDFLTPGDYDGDGRADIAVWRETNGTFFSLRSSDNVFVGFQFGQRGDQPVPRDYDGDGRTDYAVVRNNGTNLTWFIFNSATNSVRQENFGLSTDNLAPGDYDGDGRSDLGVQRAGSGQQQATFFFLQSTNGFSAVQFGLGSDIVVPGDYDGDGISDVAVLREGSQNNWFILQSSNNSLRTVQLGTSDHFSAQADYDGDGSTDVAVWVPETGNFFVIRSANGGLVTFQFGQRGDIPVANFNSY